MSLTASSTSGNTSSSSSRSGNTSSSSCRQHMLKQQERQRIPKQLHKPQPAATLEQRAFELVGQRERADRYRSQFRSRSPRVILKQLEPLEPLLTLALEKLELQPGDFQRDQIVREFADAMVVAWMSATGTAPTISKSKPLPFQRLLARVNRDILKPEIRHRTDFRYPAVFAVDRARKTRQGREPRP